MSQPPTVYLVDDDAAVRGSLSLVLRVAGFTAESYANAEEFLHAYRDIGPGCLVLDVRMPHMSGLELQETLAKRGVHLPIIFISGHADVPTSVMAMRAGAIDFLEKPFRPQQLLERVREAIARDTGARRDRVQDAATIERFNRLTPREREVMKLVAAGKSSKEIGRVLGASHRTIDIHRARVMAKMEAKSVQELTAMVMRCGLAASAQ